MIKHVYATAFLLATFWYARAQQYQELHDPRPVDASSWKAVEAGTHVRFAGTDIRYEKRNAPNPASLQNS